MRAFSPRRQGIWRSCLVLLFALATSSLRGQALSDRNFEQVSLELSEPPGFFPTDNLISNETSFQHIVPLLERLATRQGVYLGVGPDQNFTYIARTRPKSAFIVDIRRGNLLLHLYLKVLFQTSRNRWDYLSYLLGKPLPPEPEMEGEADARRLAITFNRLPSSRSYFEHNFETFWRILRERFPSLVKPTDHLRFYRIALPFFEEGLQIRYRSNVELPFPIFPTYEDLMTEMDLENQPKHFLNSEEDFQFLKRLQEENLLIPVVGNFGGTKALPSIAEYLRKKGEKVSVFYLSNVEFYLFRSGSFSQFVANLSELPHDDSTLLIRSYFNNWFGSRTHPDAVPGYYVTSLVQRLSRFLAEEKKEPYRDYWDLATRDVLVPIPGGIPIR